MIQNKQSTFVIGFRVRVSLQLELGFRLGLKLELGLVLGIRRIFFPVIRLYCAYYACLAPPSKNGPTNKCTIFCIFPERIEL